MDISFNRNGVMMTETKSADRTLDITAEVCPMTFVRTRLALDALVPGQTVLVLLRGEEPRINVPRSARALGHEVISEEEDAGGITRILIRRR